MRADGRGLVDVNGKVGAHVHGAVKDQVNDQVNGHVDGECPAMDESVILGMADGTAAGGDGGRRGSS